MEISEKSPSHCTYLLPYTPRNQGNNGQGIKNDELVAGSRKNPHTHMRTYTYVQVQEASHPKPLIYTTIKREFRIGLFASGVSVSLY